MHISDYQGNILFLMLYLHILCQCPKQNCIFYKNKFLGFIMSRPLMIVFMVSVDRCLNKNSLLILNFFFIAFILWWKTHFLIMVLFLSFPDDIEVSSDQLKRFDESVVDPKCLLKIEVIFFVLIKIYPFQAILPFLVYYYFYFRSMFYMLSEMFWNIPSTLSSS